LTSDYVDHSQPKIADIRYGGADPALAEAPTRQVTDVAADVRLRFHRLSDDTLHRAAIYIAGALVVDGVVLAVRNVGYEHHAWWGWLLVGVPLTWLSFLGLVALTFTALRGMVGILRWSLSSDWTHVGARSRGSARRLRRTGAGRNHSREVASVGIAVHHEAMRFDV
jgi:hypothetical protein